MARNPSARRLGRRLLDERMDVARPLLDAPAPQQGWISATRHALGMTLGQLAERLNVTDRAAAQMEQREAAGAITLKNLERAADALHCRVVYAFVPETSLEAMLNDEAERVATRSMDRLDHTMALESQAVDPQTRARQVADLADDLVRGDARGLWTPR